MQESTNDRLVPFSSKLAFGIGQFAEGLKNTGFGLFILFYYNQVLGLSGTLAGGALFIALMFDRIVHNLQPCLLITNTRNQLPGIVQDLKNHLGNI
ncbi:MAG: MFS transporter, partial [Pseudomonadota bacterium]|nr:MFS transporter [Pseudomonadota bacterium]